MQQSWKNDPRLKGMDQGRLELLCQFAEELKTAPKDRKMDAFLPLNRRAAEKNLHFSPAETELLLTILTEDLPPEEKKRVQLIQNLASRMKRNGS